MEILNIIFGFTFIYFGYLNINDNDAWLWVSIYLIGAICCFAAILGIYFPTFYLVFTACLLLYAMTLFFAKDGVLDWLFKHRMQSIIASMQATKPWIEKTREFFGLLILSTVLLINYFFYQ